MITYFQAVVNLVGGSITGNPNGPISKIQFQSGQTPPSEEPIQSKLKELQADYDSKQYQRDRKYPDLGEQFDLLFKDIDSGNVSKDGGFYKAIKTVKDAHPKPSE